MTDVDHIVELKLKQHNTAARVEQLEAVRVADKEIHDARFDAMERIIDEQNNLLGALNVTLDKLSKSFTAVRTLFDKWLQRVVGAAIALVVVWALTTAEPFEKIQWLWGFIK